MKFLWKNFEKNVCKINDAKEQQNESDNFCQCTGGQFDNKPCCTSSSADKKLFRTETLPLMLFIWLFAAGFYLFFFMSINQIAGELEGKSIIGHNKIKGKHSLSAYKPGIYIINSLKGTKYVTYIQSIYVNPHEKNKIMIMVKPNYWGTLSLREKKEMSNQVLKKWEDIYNKTEYSEYFKADVRFANS